MGSAGQQIHRSPAHTLYLWGVTAAVVLGLAAWAVLSPGVGREVLRAAPWAVTLFAAEMLPFPVYRDIRISLGYPLLVFLAALYAPAAVGIMAFVGTGDPRELREGSDVARSLFNRAQVAASGAAASLVFHALAPVSLGPRGVLVALAVGATHVAVNGGLVGVAARLDYRVPARSVMRGLLVGGRWSLQAAYVALGLLGVTMALVYREVGAWTLAGLLPPLLALRHLLQHSRSLEREEARLREEAERRRAARRLEEERRRRIHELAAFLHDEVVPELTASGLLIEGAGRTVEDERGEIREEIRSAVELARTAGVRVRSLIGELLHESDRLDLDGALMRLAEELEQRHDLRVHLDVEALDGVVEAPEVLFGVAREAARNAVLHGGASCVHIGARREDGKVVLTVSDDGSGFDPGARPPGDGGQGLRILRRRVEATGGRLSIVSAEGRGTVLRCLLPLRQVEPW